MIQDDLEWLSLYEKLLARDVNVGRCILEVLQGKRGSDVTISDISGEPTQKARGDVCEVERSPQKAIQ